MNIFYVPFISHYCQQVLFTLRISSLLSLSNAASVGIVDDDEGPFQFSPEAEFTSPWQNHLALHNCYSDKNKLKLLALKWLLNELLRVINKWMLKRIQSWQSKFNKFLKIYLLAPSNVPNFSTKNESMIILKMINFWSKDFAIFQNAKKIEICFPYNPFVSYIF